jgi:threonine dehydratase
MNATSQQTDAPNFEAIRAAHRRIAPHIHRTPVVTSASLDEIAGAQLFFKCENLQKTGSFKIRGATNAIFSLTDEEALRGVVAPSSGNHAAAMALAARWRGIPAYIVMPSNSSAAKMRAVESYGGKITLCEPNMASRENTCAEVMRKTGAHLVHPYDDARVIAGQGTAALELLEEIGELDVVITPASGGGLLSGTAIAAKAIRPGIRLVGGEPSNADDAYRSLASGKIQAAAQSETMADGLRATLSP